MIREASRDQNLCDEVAAEAYQFLYPLVLMDITRRVACSRRLMNTFHHAKQFPLSTFRGVVKPNFDTLYSVAWLDISEEPQVLSVPDTSGRYYVFPLHDMYTDVFATVGQRTTGTGSGNFAVTMQNWVGELPSGVTRINSPSKYVWLVGRTQTNGIADFKAVNQLQNCFSLSALSAWGSEVAPSSTSVELVVDESVDLDTPPVRQINSMSALRFFQYGTSLLKEHPPHVTDWSIVQRMKVHLGIDVDRAYPGVDVCDEVVMRALEQGASKALAGMMNQKALGAAARQVNGWSVFTHSLGTYGNNYSIRAKVSMVGLGALPPQDSVYPEAVHDVDGAPLDGSHKYILHFDKDMLPPCVAFWSITLYDAENFPHPNEIGVHAIGDRDDNLTYGIDGSLDICIQSTRPAETESNWLPCPTAGLIKLTMRLYAPSSEVLNGSWVPPVIKKLA